MMVARHQRHYQQIVAKGKEEKRGVEDPHQHRAKVSQMQQKEEKRAKKLGQG